MLVGVFHFLAVIPGRAQREPGIQRRLPNSCLDPGSALRAVRDDVRKSARRPGCATSKKTATHSSRVPACPQASKLARIFFSAADSI